jgi:DNA-directed RNA polymerase subunit H (RpoH/RPB5)
MLAARLTEIERRGWAPPLIVFTDATKTVREARAAALNALGDQQPREIILVSEDGAPEWSQAVHRWAASPAACNQLKGCLITLFVFDETLYDSAGEKPHRKVEKHWVLEGEELEAYLKSMGGRARATRTAPAILDDDPQCRRICARVGDFVAYDRRTSDGTGRERYVRVVRSLLTAPDDADAAVAADLDAEVDREAQEENEAEAAEEGVQEEEDAPGEDAEEEEAEP